MDFPPVKPCLLTVDGHFDTIVWSFYFIYNCRGSLNDGSFTRIIYPIGQNKKRIQVTIKKKVMADNN